MRARLRDMLRAGLDAEGVTFTFDLPSILLEDAGRRGMPAPELEVYLTEAMNRDDRWGTRLRAHSAHATARFWQGDADAALMELQLATTLPTGFAGYAAVALLSLANRCFEFGVPERDLGPGPQHQPAGWGDGPRKERVRS